MRVRGIMSITKNILETNRMRNSFILTFVICLLLGISACAQQSGSDGMTEKSSEISEKAKKDEPVKIGEIAPDFTLTTTDDEKITLSENKKPTMLVFYRGHW